jgi:hypothetical protein
MAGSARHSARLCAAFGAQVPRQQVHAGHPHRDAHFHLILNHAAVDVVGHLAVDLDAAVHRAGMHDDGIGLGKASFSASSP